MKNSLKELIQHQIWQNRMIPWTPKTGHLKSSNHKSKKTKVIKKSEESIKYLNETIKKTKMCIMRISKEEVNENGAESLFEKIMLESSKTREGNGHLYSRSLTGPIRIN